MLLLISLAIAILFTVLCGDLLKKRPIPFYIGSTAAALFFAVFSFKGAPTFVREYITAVFSKGALAAAFFVLVMYAGAFKAGSKAAKKLMPIRAELAIVASLLILTHLYSYGFLYIKRLIKGAISPAQALVTYLAIPLLIVFVPLAVTSFKKIRKRMKPKKWKALQRFAYLFYLLLYVHILVAYMSSARHGNVKNIINIAVYSVVFIAYAVMRASKALVKKYKDKERAVNASLRTVGAAALAVVLTVAVQPSLSSLGTDIPVSSTETEHAAHTQSSSVSSVSSKASSSAAENASSESKSESKQDKKQDNKKENSSTSSAVSSSSKSSASSIASSKAVSSASSASSSKAVSSNTENSESILDDNDEQTVELQQGERNDNNGSNEESGEQRNNEDEDESPNLSISKEAPEPEIVKLYNDGEYTAKCYEEDDDVRVLITVKITIENDRIVDIVVDTDETDPWYLDNVKNEVVPRIVEREGEDLGTIDDIDAVSGATLSSNGVKKAVKEALEQARA